jgi:hypothetical protein
MSKEKETAKCPGCEGTLIIEDGYGTCENCGLLYRIDENGEYWEV